MYTKNAIQLLQCADFDAIKLSFGEYRELSKSLETYVMHLGRVKKGSSDADSIPSIYLNGHLCLSVKTVPIKNEPNCPPKSFLTLTDYSGKFPFPRITLSETEGNSLLAKNDVIMNSLKP